MKMPPQPSAEQRLRAENAELHVRLEAAEEMLRAIRSGEVDALVVEGEAGPQIFTLQGLDAEQNRFRGEMLAQVSDAVIAMDTEDRITLLNAAAERQYGIRATDALGRKLSEIYTGLWPSPADEANAQAALRECGEWRGELIHRTPDGRELHVETVVSTLRGTDGAITGYVGSIRDISGRLRIESELRDRTHFLERIAQVTPGVLQVFDLIEKRDVFINRTVESLLGYSPEEVHAMGAEVVRRLMHPDDLPGFEEHIARVRLLADGEVAAFEFRMRERAGGWRWFHSHDAVFARDAAGGGAATDRRVHGNHRAQAR